MLVDEAVIRPLGGVALFAGGGFVVPKPLRDEADERIHHRGRAWSHRCIGGRLGGSLEDLAHRLPGHFELAGDLADRPAGLVTLLYELHIDHLQHMPFPCPQKHPTTGLTVQDSSLKVVNFSSIERPPSGQLSGYRTHVAGNTAHSPSGAPSGIPGS